jgi:ATP-dependent DNA ligase
MSSFPILYGESSHGKRKMWSVAVEERAGQGVIIVTHGYEDGKKQVNERVVSEGKNIGKKNATTPVQQAINEARALWNKKKDAKYAEASGEAGASGAAGGAGVGAAAAAAAAADSEEETTATAGDIPLPMLAHDYNKRGKSSVFPCYAQRKLDGVRCFAISGKGLFSRNGKAFPHLEHIRAEIDRLPAGTILDGELYSDELSFQEIVGLVKKESLKPADSAKMPKIFLFVYDTLRSGTNEERNAWLSALFASNKFMSLRPLVSDMCAGLEDVKRLHAQYVAEGYEGLMLRNKSGLYKAGHRSTDLQKYKEFIDEEFRIVGFKMGDGVEKGCVLWRCATAAGLEFDCRPRGSREERITQYANGASAIGKKLTVRFQEWTNDGLPRFPVGLAIRDYE